MIDETTSINFNQQDFPEINTKNVNTGVQSKDLHAEVWVSPDSGDSRVSEAMEQQVRGTEGQFGDSNTGTQQRKVNPMLLP